MTASDPAFPIPPLWLELTQRVGLSLTSAQAALLDRYLALLHQANQRMNLTRIDDPAAAQRDVQHTAKPTTERTFRKCCEPFGRCRAS